MIMEKKEFEAFELKIRTMEEDIIRTSNKTDPGTGSPGTGTGGGVHWTGIDFTIG
jgi:hypothetical protein